MSIFIVVHQSITTGYTLSVFTYFIQQKHDTYSANSLNKYDFAQPLSQYKNLNVINHEK